MLQSLPPVTRFLLIAYVVGFILQWLLPGQLALAIPIFSPAVFPGFQLWRLVTYPLMVLSFYGLIGAGLAVYFFGSELELIIHSDRLWKVILGLVVVGGVLFTFIAREGILAGPEIITIFLLTGFTYLWPKREISVMGMFFVPAWGVTLAFFIIMILPSNGTHLNTSASKIFAPIFAAVAAFVYFHWVYRQYDFGGKLADRLVGKGSGTHGHGATRNAPMNHQDRVDAILDKIASKGMSSLTQEEKDFLLESSKN